MSGQIAKTIVLLSCIGLGWSTSGGHEAAFAQLVDSRGPRRGPEMRLRINRRAARMSPVAQQEILGHVAAVRGVESGEASLGLGRGRNSGRGLQDQLSELSAVNPVVSRPLPSLWRLELPADIALDSIRVDYRLVSRRGQSGWLSSQRMRNAGIRVDVTPGNIRIVDRNEDRQLLEGGVTLELDLSTARAAGRYRGRIEVLVTQL